MGQRGSSLQSMDFIYDAAGLIIGFTSFGSNYYYGKNLQGDVTELYYNGAVIAKYTYDAWGKVLKITESSGNEIADDITSYHAAANPIRYRGYYYDADTGLYYLNSRYYNPEMCRFLNADSIISGANGLIEGNNLFSYCFNNPVNLCNTSGYAPTYSFGLKYDLGNAWYARFDRGVVGNQNHVHIWNDQKEYVFTLEGEVSHENKTGSGMPLTSN